MRRAGGALAITAAAIGMLAGAPATGVAATCGGLLQPPCPAPGPAPAPVPAQEEATVTLTPDRTEKVLKADPAAVRFSGQVSGVRNPAGITVSIDVVSKDYGLLAPSRKVQTAADGTFSAAIAPPVSATVQAIVRPALQQEGHKVNGASPIRAFGVLAPRPGFRLRVSSARTHVTFTFTARGPALIARPGHGSVHPKAGAGKVAYIYAVARGHKSATLLGKGRFRSGSCATFCTRVVRRTLPINSLMRSAVGFIACSSDDAFLGIGPGTTDETCGPKRIRLG